jgi:hypothetical protein
MRRRPRRVLLLLAAGIVACGHSPPAKAAARDVSVDTLPPELRDAALLGREVFQLVDRAVDYKGSHRGRAPTSLRQMGMDSLAPLFVRRIAVVNDSSIVTVAFRQPRGRTVAACEGNPKILEDASLSGGRFTLLCTTPSGSISQYEVPAR